MTTKISFRKLEKGNYLIPPPETLLNYVEIILKALITDALTKLPNLDEVSQSTLVLRWSDWHVGFTPTALLVSPSEMTLAPSITSTSTSPSNSITLSCL